MASSPHRLRALVPCLAAAAWLWAGPALAQATRPPAPDPTDPRQPVPRLTYRSALADATRPLDAPAVPWPAANAQVGRIGGWQTYAREAAASAPTPGASAPPLATHPHHTTPTAPPPRPAASPGGHGHHHPPGGQP